MLSGMRCDAPRREAVSIDTNYRNLAAVIGLALVGGAAVAEETHGVGIGVQPEHFDAGEAGGGEAVGDIGFEVELVVARSAVGEEAFVGGVGFGEAAEEALIDFVAGAGDARADRGGDALAP